MFRCCLGSRSSWSEHCLSPSCCLRGHPRTVYQGCASSLFRICHGSRGWIPGPPGGPRGREAERRRRTHPPPQEAERCTWRPVLQLSPETGPAGRERRRRQRGQAWDQSGEEERTEGLRRTAPGQRHRSPHPACIQPSRPPHPRERS